MKSLYFVVCLSLLALASLIGCGKDPDRPSNLAEQQSLMNGSHKPTKEQLDAAMSHIHLPGPSKGGGAPAPGKDAAPQPNK
jgi:hypothetical protein